MTVSRVLDLWQVRAVLIIVFVAFAVDYEIFNRPEAQRQQRLLETEFRQISPPPQSKGQLYRSNYKGRQALVSQSYDTPLSYPAIRSFYDQEFARNGWRFVGQEPLRDWGRDFGGVTATYCKGSFRASVQYAGAKAEYGWDYSLALSWGLYSREKCLPEEPVHDQGTAKPT